MAWKIEIGPKAIDALKKLDKQTQRRLIDYVDKRIAISNDPRRLGAPLAGKLAGLWKYRVGDYRLICEIKDAIFTVLVLNVGHRREIYKKL